MFPVKSHLFEDNLIKDLDKQQKFYDKYTKYKTRINNIIWTKDWDHTTTSIIECITTCILVKGNYKCTRHYFTSSDSYSNTDRNISLWSDSD